jgi:tRNA A37 threonylcarbamoyladenosine dehydratase
MRIEHTLPSDLLGQKPVRVLVVGAGGTGSAIVMGLPYLDQAMRVWGRSSGVEVVMMDADTVSETNCVRQPFSISDIGQNKTTVLIASTCSGERGGGPSRLISTSRPSTGSTTGPSTC